MWKSWSATSQTTMPVDAWQPGLHFIQLDLDPNVWPSRSNWRSRDGLPDNVPNYGRRGPKVVIHDSSSPWAASVDRDHDLDLDLWPSRSNLRPNDGVPDNDSNLWKERVKTVPNDGQPRWLASATLTLDLALDQSDITQFSGGWLVVVYSY